MKRIYHGLVLVLLLCCLLLASCKANETAEDESSAGVGMADGQTGIGTGTIDDQTGTDTGTIDGQTGIGTGTGTADGQTGTGMADGQTGADDGTMDDTGTLPIEGIDASHYPVIDGSTAVHPLLARVYAEILGIDAEEAQTIIPFDTGSTGSIWENMICDPAGAPDLLIVYEPPQEVKENYASELEEFEIDPIGRDALVFLVNTDLPVDNLTVGQLRGIYQGEITDWSEVGGPAGEIKPFQRNEDSGSQTLFQKLLMQGGQPMEAPTELVQDTMGGLIDSVAAFDGSGGALGYSVYYYANLMYENPSLKLLSVDGVAPSNESIADKSYPLTNDYYVVIRADEPADSTARKLRDWLLSDEGKRILEEENYVWARNGLPEESTGAGNPF